jgi:peptidyl-dipeptidase Dcp
MMNFFHPGNVLLIATSLAIFFPNNKMKSEQQSSFVNSNETIKDNPLMLNWTGPYGGVPPWDKVMVADFKPALEETMADQLTALEKISNNKK